MSVACAAALTAAAACAQQSAPLDKPVATVEVKSNADSQRRNDTASRIVVTREDITKYGDQSVLDVLKRLPGVTIGDGAPRMRGLGAGYTQVLVNGERPPAGFSLETLSPESIEKIEVMRAATAEYSTQAVAGTINVILRKTVTKATREFKASAGGAAGNRNYNVNAALSDKAASADYTLSANLTRNDTENSLLTSAAVYGSGMAPTQLRREDSFSRNRWTEANVNARVNLALGSGNSVTWQTFANGFRFTGTGDESTVTEVGPRYSYPFAVFRAGGHNSSIRTELNWVRKFDGGSKLDTRLGINRALNERAIRFFGMDKSSALLLDRATRTDIRVRGWTWTGKHSTPLVTGHALAGGWDAGDSRLGEGDVQTSVVYSPDQPRDFDNSYDARIKRIALYVQDEWDVTANWSLYLGARWEGMRIGLAGHGFAPGSSQYSVPSPLLQSLWKLPGSKGRQVRLALTRTYRAPPLAQLVPRRFYTSVSTPLTPDFYGNPDLKPELATGIDTAYEHYFASGAMVSVSGAARTIDGYIRNTVRQEGARWISMPSNQGKAHVRNLELEAKLPLKALYADAPQIDWRSSISRNWSRVDGVPGPDNRLDRQPEWSVSMGADYTRGAFKAGASYSFVSSGWTRSSLIRMDYFGARRDLEAYALVKFGPASQLRFTALNLLRPTGLSAKTYRDSLSREDSLAENPGYRGWRLQYEHKL